MIAIIGGSGVYDPKMLRSAKEMTVKTPYGEHSSGLVVGEFEGKKLAFLPRHGKKHTINPSNVNYRANIHALKSLGVGRIFGVNAVGSLRKEIAPGNVVFADQFIDRTYGRERTFYDEDKVCHINVSDPFCSNLRELLIKNAADLNLKFHEKGTYVVVEGPRFSTRAESALFRSWNADIIGMTLCPEAVLAREAEICFANISTVTDYDNLGDTLSIDSILKVMNENLEKVKTLLEKVIPQVPEERECACKDALKNALL